METEHITVFISKFEHRLSVVRMALTVSDLKLLIFKVETEYKCCARHFRKCCLHKSSFASFVLYSCIALCDNDNDRHDKF